MNYLNLDYSKFVAIDIETHDPNLKRLGPGVRRSRAGIDDSHILGVAIATESDQDYYAYTPELIEWLTNLFKNSEINWITANGVYDFDWLQYDCGIPEGIIYDVLTNDFLIYEHHKSYSLDAVAYRTTGHKKEKDEIQEYTQSQGWKGDARQYLKDVPFELVRRYGAQDARLTYGVFMAQLPRIKEDGLETVMDVESRLHKPLLWMRKEGVRVNTEQLEKNRARVADLEKEAHKKLNDLAGFEVNVNAAASLKRLYDKYGLKPGRTAKGSPSFTADVLKNTDHEVAQLVLRVKKLKKVDSTYLSGWKPFIIDGRIHPIFYPVRSYGYGTVSGRFSSALPNFQQLPSRDDELTELTRGIIIPDDGSKFFAIDYSSIEYRAFAHYARGRGADDIQKSYNETPTMDYHAKTAAIANCERRLAKTVNFMVIFGGGVEKTAQVLGLPVQKAKAFLNSYHKRLPFVKHTTKVCGDMLKKRGYIRSILGRRFHYIDKDYIAANRLTQSFGADMIKAAMVKAYESGLIERTRFTLVVHDELAGSYSDESDLQELKKIMEKAIEDYGVASKVPILADVGTGETWAQAH